MSTNLPFKRGRDEYGEKVNSLVTENGFFGSITCLVEYRRFSEGLTKSCLANLLGKDKGSVTKLTSGPTNMKIGTIANLAYAMNARAVLIFVANEDSNIIFTPTGIRNCGAMQSNIASPARRMVRYNAHLSKQDSWAYQPKEVLDV